MSSEKENYCNTSTTFTSMELGMEHRVFILKLRKIICISFISVLVLFLVLFFSLPCFQNRGTFLSGNYLFENSDILTLSGLNKSNSNLFFSSDKAKESLLSSTSGLILDCDFESNGMISNGKIQEDHVVASYDGIKYFSSGKNQTEVKDIILNLNLTDTQKEKINSKFNQSLNSNVPSIHLPLGVSSSIENAKIGFAKLSGVSSLVLSTMVGVQFVNDNQDSNWSDVAYVLFKNENQYYLLKNILTDKFSDYVSDNVFPDKVFENIKEVISKKNLQTKTFSFDDDDQSYDVYSFKFIYNVEKGSITINAEEN